MLCQLLGQHWSAMQAHSAIPGHADKAQIFSNHPPPPHLRQHAPNNHVLDLVVACMVSPFRTLLSCWLRLVTLMPRWMDDRTATCRLHLKMGQRALNNHVP